MEIVSDDTPITELKSNFEVVDESTPLTPLQEPIVEEKTKPVRPKKKSYIESQLEGFQKSAQEFTETAKEIPGAEQAIGVAETIGGFLPISPGVAFERTFREQTDRGESGGNALHKALESAGIDAAMYYTGGKVAKHLPAIGEFLTKQLVSDKNEKLVKFVADNPEVIFTPKTTWQKAYNEAFDFLSSQKKSLGEAVGNLKSKAREIGYDLSKSTKPIVEKIDSALNFENVEESISKESGFAIKALNKIRDKIVEKGKKSLLVDKAGQQLGQGVPEKAKNMSIDDLEILLKDTDELLKKVAKKTGKEAIQGVDNTERILLGVQRSIRDTLESMVNDIPDVGGALKDAKSGYSKLLKINKAMGNLTAEKMPGKIDQSMQVNKEHLWDNLQEVLNPELFKKVIAKALNKGGENYIIEAGRGVSSKPSGIREIARQISKPIAKVSAGLRGTQPSYEIGGMGQALMTPQARQAADILRRSAGLGLRQATEKLFQ